jgi:hypothetical protein
MPSVNPYSKDKYRYSYNYNETTNPFFIRENHC